MGLRVIHLVVGVAGLIAFVASGVYMVWVQGFGSVLILAGPFMLAASFFAEQHNPELDRPVGQLAIFLALGGALLDAVAALGGRIGSGAS